MSWGTQAIGKPRAVAKKVAANIGNIKLTEPEEAFKNRIGAVIVDVLMDFPEDQAVKVSAAGSQQYADFHDYTKGRSHTLHISIEPIWGFVS